MKALVGIILLAVGAFAFVLIFQKKRYYFNRDNEMAERVKFYNRYKDGQRLEPRDEGIFTGLKNIGLVTSRGTEILVDFTAEGRKRLAEDEFNARCDLRARVQRFLSNLWAQVLRFLPRFQA